MGIHDHIDRWIAGATAPMVAPAPAPPPHSDKTVGVVLPWRPSRSEPMTKAVDDLWAIVNGWPGVVGVSDVSDSPCGPYLVVLAAQPELIMTAVPEFVHGIPVVVQQSDRIVAQTGRTGTHVGSFPEGAASSRSTEALGLLALTWGAIGGFMYLKNMARERARAKR